MEGNQDNIAGEIIGSAVVSAQPLRSAGDIVLSPIEKKQSPLKRILIILVAVIFLGGGGAVAWHIVWNLNGADITEVARVWGEGNVAVLRLDEFFHGIWDGRIAADRMLFDEDTMGLIREDMASLKDMHELASGHDYLKYGTQEQNDEFLEMRDEISYRYEKYTEYMEYYAEFKGIFGPEVVLSLPYSPNTQALELTRDNSLLRVQAARAAIAYYEWASGGALENDSPYVSASSYVGIFFAEEPVLPEALFNRMRGVLIGWGFSE